MPCQIKKKNVTTKKLAKTLGANQNAATDVHNHNDKTNASHSIR